MKQNMEPQVLAANEITEVYHVHGTYFKLYSISESEGVEVRVNGRPWQQILASHADEPQEGIRSIQFKNLSASPNTIVWAVWPWSVKDNLFVFTSSELSQIRDQLRGSITAGTAGKVTLVAVTATQILAANADRVGCNIQNEGQDDVYLGFSNAVDGNNAFVKLESNQAWTFENYRGDIYAYSAGTPDLIYGEWE